MRKIFGYLWYRQSDRNHVWNLSEVASLVHTIKHQQVLTHFFFGFLSSFFGVVEAAPSRPSSSACSDECRAANPCHEDDDGKGPANIFNMLRWPGLTLCSAFLLVPRCIAFQERRDRVGAGDGKQGGVLFVFR